MGALDCDSERSFTSERPWTFLSPWTGTYQSQGHSVERTPESVAQKKKGPGT